MSEKQHKPTQRRLEDARREGEVVRSADVVGALVFIGVLMLLWQGGPWLLERLRGLLVRNVAAAARAHDPSAAVVQALVSAGGSGCWSAWRCSAWWPCWRRWAHSRRWAAWWRPSAWRPCCRG
ncbi:EscU/YscU/HrcU family type III secretion system export apparatus switch protein [Ralstonia mannitolilytica]|uniref:EscU/YscU/HrcU family type III secretion system export apparatus switch protein n=1 Tax=Ralstonia mannitolilytica TaxID=105219 RepID=UPI00289E5290|nr:EscU/YscU/HrcU family type III secretion system export apparatus switch protein [Ralstonia mannitolilytica]